MFNVDVTEKMIEAVELELRHISEKYGSVYNSMHEGYSIFKEEFEEAEQELESLRTEMNNFWLKIKRNESCIDSLQMMETRAQLLVLEAIQCCAVLYKIKRESKKDRL